MTQQEVKLLLVERAKTIEKRKNRVALFLYVVPIIYFLLQSSILNKVEYAFIEISQIEIVNLFTPIVYSLMIFYFVFLNEDAKALKMSIDIPPDIKENVPYFFSQDYLIFPPNLIFELLRNMKYRNFTSEIGTIFIFFPLGLILLCGPLVFLFYSCYYVLVGLTIEDYYLNFISAGLAFWLFIATLLYSSNRKKETESLKLL